MIILLFSFLGELLKYVLPFPVPASIYGLVLLFIALEKRILPLAAVKDAGKFMNRNHAVNVYSGRCRTH